MTEHMLVLYATDMCTHTELAYQNSMIMSRGYMSCPIQTPRCKTVTVWRINCTLGSHGHGKPKKSFPGLEMLWKLVLQTLEFL